MRRILIAFYQTALHETKNTPKNTNRPTSFISTLTTARTMDGLTIPHQYRHPCAGSPQGVHTLLHGLQLFLFHLGTQ
jgi:hypothetical protein